MERLRAELQQKSATEERNWQKQESAAEAARAATEKARTMQERVEAYRISLLADKRLTSLKILNMSSPVEMKDIYVKLRVHEESTLTYKVDPLLQEAEARQDPNALLRAGHRYLESRVNTSLDCDDLLQHHKRCIVLGDPGAGKTTLLKHLTIQCVTGKLQNVSDIPIHVELNAFANSGLDDLITFAAGEWDKNYGFPASDAQAFMNNALHAGSALVLLDALDEAVVGQNAAVAEASYLHVVKAILQLATRYPDAPIVVTARKAGYSRGRRLDGFTELDVLDFSPEDIRTFIHAWFVAHSNPVKSANGEDLIKRLENAPRLRALAATPLLLALIVIVYEQQLDLPERRADLYKRCVEVLLNEWDATRDIRRRREFTPDNKSRLLEEIAWHFHLKGRRYFPTNELLNVIAQFLPTIDLPNDTNLLILEELTNENGLLKEQAQGWYGFLHLTLQEYFAARYAVNHDELETLLRHRYSAWWEEVVLLYAGAVTDASPLFQQLLSSDDLFHSNLFLAGQCLAARPTVKKVVLRDEVIDRLFNVIDSDRFRNARRAAVANLTRTGGRDISERLILILQDASVDDVVRWSVATALGTLGDRTVVPALLALLSDASVDDLVRWSVATTLGTLGDRTVVPALLTLLSDTSLDAFVRRSVATAIGALGDHTDVPMLLALLPDASLDALVRRSVATAIGALGNHTTVPALLTLLSDTSLDAFVRESVAAAIGALGDHTDVPMLLTLLSDASVDDSVRWSIAAALGALGERAVVPTLLTLLSDASVDVLIRWSVATALGTLGDHTAVPVLLTLLSDASVDDSVRESVADALEALSDHTDIPALLALLQDASLDALVRRSVADMLGALGDHTAVPALLTLLSDASVDDSVRGSVAAALGQLGSDESTSEVLAVVLQETDLPDMVYGALLQVSRRADVLVREMDGGRIVVEPLNVETA